MSDILNLTLNSAKFKLFELFTNFQIREEIQKVLPEQGRDIASEFTFSFRANPQTSVKLLKVSFYYSG